MPVPPPRPTPRVTHFRIAACLGLLGLLSACAGHAPPPMTATQEAAVYKAKAKSSYFPPGPPDDPWGPYVTEASQRFDVPDRWIREVMRVESGGYQFRASGALTTSPVGAMGLMQLMPETYDEVRARYGLGDDAFDPHNNILAGAAYIREMYDAFGSPGFLAAYNAGPARLEDYLTHNRPLPDETRRYVYMIGTRINDVFPQKRAPAEQFAVNQIPINIPAGPRYQRHVNYALAAREKRRHGAPVRYAAVERHTGRHAPVQPQPQQPIEVAEAPDPRPARAAYAAPAHRGGLHLITPAYATEVAGRGGSDWGIQVGAYGNAGQARAAAGAAQGKVGHAGVKVATVRSGHATLYRARLSGMTHDKAVQACQRLHGPCMIVSPSSL